MASLLEGLSSAAAEKGKTKFSQTKLTDPHIVKAIKLIVKNTIQNYVDHGVKPVPTPKEMEAKVYAKIAHETKEMEDVKQYAPKIYSTIVANIVESEIFDMLKGTKVEEAPEFSVTTFYKLIRIIKIENDQFFPMRSFIDHKALINPRYVIVPSAKEKGFNDVNTAAATADGIFIFNVEFMQQLIDFAHLKEVKGRGKKYVSNKGDIPDEYAYIEFLIMHEFMHYTYADFHYGDIIKNDAPNHHKIINYVGDFRTNYNLVKNGFAQLPMGLFSDDINYDRMKTYKEMYDTIDEEFKKIPKAKRSWLEEMLDKLTDDHKKREDPDKAKKPKPPIDPTEIDKHHRDVVGKSERRDAGEEEDKANGPRRKTDPGSGGRGGQSKDTKDDGTSAFDYTKVKPKLSWTALLAKFVSTESGEEDSYSKPHRRSITNIHVAQQTGAGAIKPSQVESSHKKIKLCVVVDSSGSMTGAITKVYANLNNLLKKHFGSLSAEFFLIKFSNDFHVYRCAIKGNQGSYVKVNGVDAKGGGTFEKGSLQHLFTQHFGSSTNFNTALGDEIMKLVKKHYNVLIVSDSDITESGNMDTLRSLYLRAKRNIFVLADSRSTYSSIIQNLREIGGNITFLPNDDSSSED